MRNAISLGFLLVGWLPLCGCSPAVVGSGTMASVQHDFSGLEALTVQGSYDVELSQGPASLTITADDNVLPHLKLDLDNDRLVLGVSDEVRLRNATIKAKISMPILEELDLQGASSVKLEGIECADLKLDLSGACNVEGSITANDLELDMSGACRAKLAGVVDNIRADLSGASRLEFSELMSGDIHLDLSGACSAKVASTGAINADLSGASHLTYNSDATLGRVDTSGASSISSY